jgi:hypothetical protein
MALQATAQLTAQLASVKLLQPCKLRSLQYAQCHHSVNGLGWTLSPNMTAVSLCNEVNDVIIQPWQIL